MEGRHFASRWAVVHGAALASSLVACIGPNPDFSERPLATTGTTTDDPATTDPVTSGRVTTGPTTTGSSAAEPDTSGTTFAVDDPSTDTTATTEPTDLTGDPLDTGTTTLATTDTTDTGQPTSGGPNPCGTDVITINGGRLDLVFVVDRSAAMMTPWDHDGDDLDLDGLLDSDPQLPATAPVARWSSVHAAITEISQRFDASVRMGLSFYPSQAASSSGAAACPVAVPIEGAIASDNAALVTSLLPPPDAPLTGARPAAKAVQAAVTAITSRAAGARKKLLYLTSGDANCGSRVVGPGAMLETHDEALEAIVLQAKFDAILTHVIGVGVADMTNPTAIDGEPDGVNPFQQLNILAQCGGTARAGAEKFWAADDEAELLAALDTSIRHGLSCAVVLPRVPSLPFNVQVRIGEDDYPTVTDCDGEDGWHFAIEGDYDEIELCGAACAAFQELGALTTGYYCEAG